MKNMHWKILFSIALAGLSVLLYLLHYRIFRDSHHIFLYLSGDLALLPLNVLLAIFVIEHMTGDIKKGVQFINSGMNIYEASL